MNATIRDKSVLEAIRPMEAAAYLRANGWTVAKEEPGKFSVWNKSANSDEPFEVVLLLDRHYRDFALRMSDLLQTLQIVEQRSELDILSDIQTASADVVRVRFRQPEMEDGAIALCQGLALLENARELMLAAACATVEPRVYFATRKPDRAKEYVSQLRLGQSETGSYVLRILSPVAPRLTAEQGGIPGEPESPFTRSPTTSSAH